MTSALETLGEYFAAGYYELPGAPLFLRWSRAYRRHFEHRPVDDIIPGASLAPSGKATPGTGVIVKPSYSFSWIYDGEEAERLCSDSSLNVDEIEALGNLQHDFDEFTDSLHCITSPHIIGGRGYTHSIPNYGRILREGLDAYASRILAFQNAFPASEIDDAVAGDGDGDPAGNLYAGLLDLITGIKAWHSRVIDRVSAVKCDTTLLSALRRVPFLPARTFYESLVAYNFIYYLDGCDNPGRFDQELIEFYRHDIDAGILDEAEALKLIIDFFRNVDANNGWSLGIGGTARDGDAGFNELTVLCLRAGKGMRRPNLQLHIRNDMPDEVWDGALDSLAEGSGLPALYNDDLFDRALEFTGNDISPGDRWRRNGGGCTETMMHGCSNVGSLDAGLNLPLILTETIATAAGIPEETFDSLMTRYRHNLDTVIAELTSQISDDQRAKARFRPHPVRTLLIEDCIDKGIEYNSGGARYNWSVVNIAGLANVADSLEAIRMEVFVKKNSSLASVQAALEANFVGNEALRLRLASHAKYGNDISSVDEIAHSIAGHVFDRLLAHEPWRGGRFIGSCLMFVTYAPTGGRIPATPDGRLAGTPIADSFGPMQGRDTHGPTAMLRSVASLPQRKAPGTLVVNARFDRRMFASPNGRRKIRNLIETYFELGGMQLQINTIDQRTIEEAIRNPEQHNDLIVRVGGYSEYFNRLSDELKHTLLERVEHSA